MARLNVHKLKQQYRIIPTSGPYLQSSFSQDKYIYLGAVDSVIFRWLYTRDNADFVDTENIPKQLIWDTMREYASPIYNEYVETTDCLPFLKVKRLFFEVAFWAGEIFIGPNLDIKDIYDIENPNYFGLWIRKGKTNDGKDRFINVLTGKEQDIEKWEDELVVFTWPDRNLFSRWYNFAWHVIKEEKMFRNLAALTAKVAEVRTEFDAIQDGYRTTLETQQTAQRLYNSEAYIDASFEPTSIKLRENFNAEYFNTYTLAVFRIRDRRLAELGRVANMNPKGERLTTGENYKDLIAVANRQRAVLDELKLMAGLLEQKYGFTLKFALNGIPERQMSEADVEQADNTQGWPR